MLVTKHKIELFDKGGEKQTTLYKKKVMSEKSIKTELKSLPYKKLYNIPQVFKTKNIKNFGIDTENFKSSFYYFILIVEPNTF